MILESNMGWFNLPPLSLIKIKAFFQLTISVHVIFVVWCLKIRNGFAWTWWTWVCKENFNISNDGRSLLDNVIWLELHNKTSLISLSFCFLCKMRRCNTSWAKCFLCHEFFIANVPKGVREEMTKLTVWKLHHFVGFQIWHVTAFLRSHWFSLKCPRQSTLHVFTRKIFNRDGGCFVVSCVSYFFVGISYSLFTR